MNINSRWLSEVKFFIKNSYKISENLRPVFFLELEWGLIDIVSIFCYFITNLVKKLYVFTDLKMFLIFLEIKKTLDSLRSLITVFYSKVETLE